MHGDAASVSALVVKRCSGVRTSAAQPYVRAIRLDVHKDKQLRTTTLFLAILLAACRSQQPPVDEQLPGRLILRGAVLLDGRDTVPRHGMTITIRAGRIEAVAPDAATRAPKQADSIIDLRGAWVVPGLIDAHAHIGYDRDSSLAANTGAAQRALAKGVTTIRSMAVPGWADVRLRQQFDAGIGHLPRILPSGNGVVPIVSDSWVSDFPEIQPLTR